MFIWLHQVLVQSSGLQITWASLVVASRLSCSVTCGTRIPCIARQILNHWATREVPTGYSLLKYFLKCGLIWDFPQKSSFHGSIFRIDLVIPPMDSILKLCFSCSVLSNSLQPCYFVHGILQAKVLV